MFQKLLRRFRGFDFCRNDLINAGTFHIDDFKPVTGKSNPVGEFGNAAEHIHQKTGHGFVTFIIRHFAGAEQPFDIFNRCGTLNAPRSVFVFHDLLRIVGGNKVAHDDPKNVFEGDDADSEGVLVDDGGKIAFLGFEDIQGFRKRQCVGNGQYLGDETAFF